MKQGSLDQQFRQIKKLNSGGYASIYEVLEKQSD